MNEKLKDLANQMDDLRTKRSEMQFKHAKEIGELDNAINQAWSKLSSLVSTLERNV